MLNQATIAARDGGGMIKTQCQPADVVAAALVERVVSSELVALTPVNDGIGLVKPQPGRCAAPAIRHIYAELMTPCSTHGYLIPFASHSMSVDMSGHSFSLRHPRYSGDGSLSDSVSFSPGTSTEPSPMGRSPIRIPPRDQRTAAHQIVTSTSPLAAGGSLARSLPPVPDTCAVAPNPWAADARRPARQSHERSARVR